MNTGHIKEATEDDSGFRQFIINCLGPNDKKKYFSITPFGIDFNAPVDTRALTTDSSNKDIKFNLGVLNKLKIADLLPGESAIFSTDEACEAIVSKIVLRNTGAIEITAGEASTIVVTGDATIQASGDVNLTADGNVVVTATQFSANGNFTVD